MKMRRLFYIVLVLLTLGIRAAYADEGAGAASQDDGSYAASSTDDTSEVDEDGDAPSDDAPAQDGDGEED
jgi:hypothetical protein